ncbi:MAG TPA: phenylalanine--tRNA ligase subunit beta [Actinomycetes bacterium]|nr:phenylalanine--tRNA ligase subunit beta [Actinomycetes bacterium]
MRVPLSWLADYVDLPAGVTARELAERITRAGLEVETVDQVGIDITGPLLVGEVLSIEELTGLRKPIRWCQVRTAPDGPTRGVICGATNFAAGDRVVVALPGAILPGPFVITARPTYGHVSDGMICSARELGLGDDHTGILVLPPDTELGADAIELLELRDDVLDIAVTPDRGYGLSVRGIAREVAIAYRVPFRDPGLASAEPVPAAGGPDAHPASIDDPTACDRFVLRTVSGFDPAAPSPLWLRRRLYRAGMRPVSLAVDVTNYVMLELGQPLHAFDRKKLAGPIVVRRARPGERLETLDHVQRELDPEDILITDPSGPISLAGTMGGLHTEIDESSTELVIEAAHFSAVGTARMARRHKLTSEASRRFERGVDPELPPVASARAVALLTELGGGLPGGMCDVDLPRPRPMIRMAAGYPATVAGREILADAVVDQLAAIGAEVRPADGADGPQGSTDRAAGSTDVLEVVPPSWRPDLTDPADLAEEVLRLEGYDSILGRLPRAPAGRGLSPMQRLRRRVGMTLAGAGYVEVICYPFVGPADWDALGLPVHDSRRQTVRLVNPLSAAEPELRTTLLPGLLRTLARNVGRGCTDVALVESGLVYLPGPDADRIAPRPPVDRRPTDEEIAALESALPDQPRYLAVVLAGNREPAGWWGPGRAVSWADAIEAARIVAAAVGVPLEVTATEREPWHPGRAAHLFRHGKIVGYAGELHPRVIEAFGLPPRVAAMELDLDALIPAELGPAQAPAVSTYPVATQDVALVVDASVPVAAVTDALAVGAGPLLESVRLFDVYTGAQVGAGRQSLAFTLRFRAPDRTLTVEETTAARDAAVAEANRRTGAVLRGT